MEDRIQKKKGIDYTYLYSGDKGERVCFMMPGIRYSVDRPILYYTTKLLLKSKIDVVQLDYSYGSEITSYENLIKIMVDDIKPVISDVLQNHDHQEIFMLGKSIGTVPIVEQFIRMTEFLNTKIILLTPLLNYDSFLKKLLKSKQKILIIIGDKDSHYREDKIYLLNDKMDNAQVKVIAGANHSLEIESGEVSKSIEILQFVLDRIDRFIKI